MHLHVLNGRPDDPTSRLVLMLLPLTHIIIIIRDWLARKAQQICRKLLTRRKYPTYNGASFSSQGHAA
jgi:hypothetical protein